MNSFVILNFMLPFPFDPVSAESITKADEGHDMFFNGKKFVEVDHNVDVSDLESLPTCCASETSDDEAFPSLDLLEPLIQGSENLIRELRDKDVICGRSTKQIELHPGNCWFRNLVADNKDNYKGTRKRKEKQAVLNDVILQVLDQGGRFVEKLVQLANGDLRPHCVRDRLEEQPGNRIVYLPAARPVFEEKVRKALRRDDNEKERRSSYKRRDDDASRSSSRSAASAKKKRKTK